MNTPLAMPLLLWLSSSVALAQEAGGATLPKTETPAAAVELPVPDAPGPVALPQGPGEEGTVPEAVDAEGLDAEGPDAQGPDAEGGADTGVAEEAPPEPWQPVPEADRVVDGVPQLGPWPDDWSAESDGHVGLPVVDPLTGDVVDLGRPFDVGPELGPERPPELLGPFLPTDAAAQDQPPDAVAAEPGESEADDMPADAAADGDPQAVVAPVAAPAPVAERRRSIAEDLLPPPPQSGGHRAFLFAVLALLAFLGSEVTERLQERVLSKGLLPRFLSMLTGIGRGLTIPLVFIAALSLLPHSWGLAVPFALVALALAFGWTARDLLGDVFAGIVLTIERRVQTGERIEVGGHKGVVQGLGLRTTRLTVDDGRMVSMPNRQLLRQDLRVDPDSYAPVTVPVHVHPHLSVGEVRQQLQELALLSPYIAPSRPPNVYRDADRPEVWIVEARLVHPRFANAFRGAVVELADEVFTAGNE